MSMKDPQAQMLTVSKWVGVNQLVTASELKDNEMSYAQDIQLIEDGYPDKRNGYERVFEISLGNGKINGAYEAYFNNYIVFAWSNGLYKQSGTAQPEQIYNSLTDYRGYFFAMSGNLYYHNSYEYVQIKPDFTVATVQSVAFIPTTVIARLPAGGGTTLEAVNLLQPKRKNSFIGDGVTKTYVLDATNLDATTVVAVVGGVTLVENTDFTVDRTAGTVTFTNAPANGNGVDNVIITFAKTISGYADKILKCDVQPVLFGGNNDTRVFMAKGNIRYHSGLYDATYFPDINYTKIGNDQNSITRFSQLGDTQIIFKEHKENEPSIWSSRFELDSNSVAYFPVIPINGMAGCDAKNCCEIVLNNPTFFDTNDGIYSLTYSNVRDQRVVSRQSDRINAMLLTEENKQNAVSFIWNYRFGVALNGNVYVWDYRLDAWYGKWTNINASCFFTINGELYFGSSTAGFLYKFNDNFDDDGEAIKSHFFTKYFSYSTNFRKKLLSRIYVDIKSATSASVVVSYMTENMGSPKVLPEVRRDLLAYNNFNYSTFTYSANIGFPKPALRKTREKNAVWIQFKFENNKLNDSMPIISTQYEYSVQQLVKDY